MVKDKVMKKLMTIEEEFIVRHNEYVALEEQAKHNLLKAYVLRGALYVEYMNDTGATQKQAGKFFGVSATTISNYSIIYNNVIANKNDEEVIEAEIIDEVIEDFKNDNSLDDKVSLKDVIKVIKPKRGEKTNNKPKVKTYTEEEVMELLATLAAGEKVIINGQEFVPATSENNCEEVEALKEEIKTLKEKYEEDRKRCRELLRSADEDYKKLQEEYSNIPEVKAKNDAFNEAWDDGQWWKNEEIKNGKRFGVYLDLKAKLTKKEVEKIKSFKRKEFAKMLGVKSTSSVSNLIKGEASNELTTKAKYLLKDLEENNK